MPALMKFILSGEMEEEVIVGVDADGKAIKEKNQVDPRETLRRVLYDTGLDGAPNSTPCPHTPFCRPLSEHAGYTLHP